MKGFSPFLFGLVDAKVGLTNGGCEIVVYKSGAKEIDAKEEVKVGIEKEAEVGIKGEAEVGIKEGAEIDTKGEAKDGKLDAKVGAKEVKVPTVRIFGFYIKISCNFGSFGIIE